ETFQAARDASEPSVAAFLWTTAANYSPLMWLGVIGAIIGTDLSKATRLMLGGLLALQCIVIHWLLVHDPRYLGGLQHGLLIAFAAFATRSTEDSFASTRSLVAACATLLLPLLGIQAYYAKQLLPVVLGLESTALY